MTPATTTDLSIDRGHGSISETATGRGEQIASSAVQPVIAGFHSDPTVCRVGDDYYLATSSFEYFPGAPIFHSKDLISWRQIGHVMTRRSQFPSTDTRPSSGIYGSTLRYHDGTFWFITTNVSEFASGQVIVHAQHPEGPWSEPVLVPQALGIDPDLCWDDDGTCYLTWHVLDFEVGGQGLSQAPIDLATGRLLEEPYPVWQGSGMAAAEGPHLYRRGAYWYLLLAEGGTERGHSVTIARATHPRGPFEPHPDNPILTHRSSSHPVQNVGHADLVEAPDGGWAAVYLGVRPQGSTPGFHVIGRETFLAAVQWEEDWPVFREEGFAVPVVDASFVDDFAPGAALHSRWVVPDGELRDAVREDASGAVTLVGGPTSVPLCTRVLDLRWQADATFARDGEFAVRIDARHQFALVFEDGRVRAEAQIGPVRQVFGDQSVDADVVTLRIEAVDPLVTIVPFGGPDEIVLSVAVDGAARELARLDGRYLSTEVASGFTGRVLTVRARTAAGTLDAVAYRAR